MPFKISGIELVRRLKERAPDFDSLAEHCLKHSEEIKRKIDELNQIAGRAQSVILPVNPEQIWQARAESYKAKADDLRWLSGSISEDQIHEITGEELVNLGLIGLTQVSALELLGESSE